MWRWKTIQGLSYWHKDTLSAYTMIAVIISSIIQFKLRRTITNLLVLAHVIVHAPFSIKYHAEHDILEDNIIEQLNNMKNDVRTIYISHMILHYALSYNIPWVIKSMTFTIFLCCCSLVFEDLEKCKTQFEMRNCAIKYSWIFILHYFPIIWTNGISLAIIHLLFYSCGFGLYTSKIIKNDTINNAIMHCGIIINNMFAHKFVT